MRSSASTSYLLMSHSTNRVFQAFEAVNAAIAEFHAAQEGISDEEFTQDLPSVLVCTYEPLKKQAGFTLLGTVHHVANVLVHAMDAPENLPFSHAFTDALGRYLTAQGD